MIRECAVCDVKFESNSPAKLRAGGLVNTCPDCSSEPTTRYLGLTSGDGKAASVTILAFDSREDREAYRKMWRNNSGMHKGKSCQLGSHLSTTPNVKFRTVTQSLATNHKGKA